MAWTVLIFLFVLPAAEIAAFIQVAHWIGWVGAFLGLALSAMLGVSLLQSRGASLLIRVQEQLRRGEAPESALFDGAIITAACALLIIPGYLTDLLAIALLLPSTRFLLGAWLLRGLFRRPGNMSGNMERRSGASSTTVIEGEWEVVSEPTPPRETSTPDNLSSLAPPADRPKRPPSNTL